MNQVNPQVEALLEQLEPIVAPPAPGFWPPAPGWWLLAALTLAAMVALVVGLRRWRARGAYRRQALLELARLEPRATPAYAMQVESLLKRAALHACPNQREAIARLHGRPWLAFLERMGGSAALVETGPVITEALYRPAMAFDAGRVQREVRAWLKRHRPQKSGDPANV